MIYIYCDESCHLENDLSNIMVLGGLSVPSLLKQEVFIDIRKIKEKHHLSSWFEIKWTKVSEAKLEFYSELIDYFFDKDYLNFRGIVMKDKNKLDHEQFGNTYDDWYYRMYYFLLNPMILPEKKYKIFIDIKDTQGGKKVNKLHSVLSNSYYDFEHDVIKDIKQILSHESEVMQLCDLIIGALSFYHRGLYSKIDGSYAKKYLVKKIIEKSGINLNYNTSKYANKFNLLVWEPRNRGGC